MIAVCGGLAAAVSLWWRYDETIAVFQCKGGLGLLLSAAHNNFGKEKEEEEADEYSAGQNLPRTVCLITEQLVLNGLWPCTFTD